jgi:hypothetical protein
MIADLVAIATAATAATAVATTAATTAAAAAATVATTASAAAATVTAAAAATTTAVAATATTAATWTGRSLTGFVHGQGATVHLMPIKRRDRGLQTFVGLHLHESEAARPAGLTIRNHFGTADGAVRREHCL